MNGSRLKEIGDEKCFVLGARFHFAAAAVVTISPFCFARCSLKTSFALRISPQTAGTTSIPCEVEPSDNNNNHDDCHNHPDPIEQAK